jgi:7-cyano-7-deazaguanine synthase in queuosine biosynthesis
MTTAFITLEEKFYLNDVCLLFSGGVESTLLFYLLASRPRVQKMSLYIIDRHNNPLKYAYAVHSLVSKKIKSDEYKLYPLSIPLVENHQEISVAAKIIKLSKNHKMLICGFNKYPPCETIRPKYLADPIETDYIKFPLKNYTKDFIIDQYYKLGIEDILPYTHSCGSNQLVPCSECFNCRERSWAYKKLNLDEDLGS